jgi:hypothetical protein
MYRAPTQEKHWRFARDEVELAIEERSFGCVSRPQKPREKQNRAKLRSG